MVLISTTSISTYRNDATSGEKHSKLFIPAFFLLDKDLPTGYATMPE
jgi:hypothetical protein